MILTDKILNWLDSLGRKRVILDRAGNEPYLERYYVFLKDRKRFPFNIFVHKFLKSDPDDVHDHPWFYATLILKGGYYEYVPIFNDEGIIFGEKKYWRGPGHFRICCPSSYHRIELDPNITAWTLFMPGPQVREWGFLVGKYRKQQWVHNEQYLKERNEQVKNII
jgi:hypothetical protein